MTEHIYAHEHPESDASRTAASRSGSPASRARQDDDRAPRRARSSSGAACIVEYLDGDTVRTHLSKGLGFSKEDRDTNIERIGWVASRLTRHGARRDRRGDLAVRGDARRRRARWSRSAARSSRCYVDASVEECARRDVKGLYAKAFAGEIKGFTGVDDPYEEPDDRRARARHRGARARGVARSSSSRKLEELGLVPARGGGMSVAPPDKLIEPHGGDARRPHGRPRRTTSSRSRSSRSPRASSPTWT